jgi:predicted component of type VI protein secretion system
MTIGRADAEVMLEDPEVSRHHARIKVEDGVVTLEDLGSRNGTYVNDETVRAARPLQDGDVIRLGHTAWRLESADRDQTRLQPAATAPHAPALSRGDVPAPPAHQPVASSAPAPVGGQGELPPFRPSAKSSDPGRSRRQTSAARRAEATVISYAIVAATAAAVIIYLAAR